MRRVPKLVESTRARTARVAAVAVVMPTTVPPARRRRRPPTDRRLRRRVYILRRTWSRTGVCWDGGVPGFVRTLRERVRGTERARVVSDAATTVVAGLALLAVGLVGLWGGGPSLATNRWWFVLTLVAMGAVMLGKARSPLLSLGAGVLVFGADAVLGGSMGVMIGLLDLIYSAALRVSGSALRRLSVAVVVSVTGGAAAAFGTTGDLRAT